MVAHLITFYFDGSEQRLPYFRTDNRSSQHNPIVGGPFISFDVVISTTPCYTFDTKIEYTTK